MESGGQGEVAEVVGGELHFPSFGGSLQAAGDQSGIVDQQMQWTVPLLHEACDADLVGEVQWPNDGPTRTGRRGDRFGNFATRCGITYGKGHCGSGGSQGAGSFGSNSR